MEAHYCLLRSQLLQLANSPDIKEYEAQWRKDGAKILRQGGKFASDSSKPAKKIIGDTTKNIAKLSNDLEKQMANLPDNLKENISDLFKSSNIKKLSDSYAEKLNTFSKGSGKLFKDLIQDSTELFANKKPEKAVEKMKINLLDAVENTGYALEVIALGAGFIFSAPIAALATGGVGLLAIGQVGRIRDFSIENVQDIGGIVKGYDALNKNKPFSEVWEAFTEGGNSQINYEISKDIMTIGTWLIYGALGLTAVSLFNGEVEAIEKENPDFKEFVDKSGDILKFILKFHEGKNTKESTEDSPKKYKIPAREEVRVDVKF